ncbi:hypothetical protein CDV55_105953 [Aspergillus turcosus]|nr:hypothetical protein CDV55_105953 [Aspergillus turcosus]
MDVTIYKATVPKTTKQSLNKVTRVTGLGRPQVEPFARTLVSLMLIEAICELSGYSGDDEGEARDPKNWDVVFLDQVRLRGPPLQKPVETMPDNRGMASSPRLFTIRPLHLYQQFNTTSSQLDRSLILPLQSWRNRQNTHSWPSPASST